jgi:hypothetical protein
MKTSIYISGQINGNSTLRNAIITADCEEKKGMFNSITLTFPSKKAANKAMWEAYKQLRQDKQDAQASMLSYTKGYISYDASTAKISEE